MGGMKGWFITGTDTGVGKTAVLAALLCALRRAGRDAAPMKPVQTGCRRTRGGLVPPDLETALRAAGFPPGAARDPRMCPYRFAPACSPHLAAARAGTRIRLSVILKAFRQLAREHSVILVEGAGGLLVPLNERETMLDLMKALALPVVVAARPGLGTLNHTLLTLRELRREGLRVGGVILVCTRPGRWGAIERDNMETLRRRGRVPVYRLSYGRGPPPSPRMVREAEHWLKDWT
ncbi:MAG: dethiobiotin synthase [Kiritimatiellae bacterium]|nr:dethiobiotin synthase [Kiritimatiellia bacterium]